MSGPAWRMGEGKFQLAVAGFWTVQLDAECVDRLATLALGPATVVRPEPQHPLLITGGGLKVGLQEGQRQARRLLRLGAGDLLVPIAGREPSGLRWEPEQLAGVYLRPQWLTQAASVPALARVLFQAAVAAIEEQYWVRALAARAEPLARLSLLLLRIAADSQETGEHGKLIRGAPDVREMGVLAGVSRENALIDLEWLVHAGVLVRHEGRLFLRDEAALRSLAQPGT